MTMVRGFALGAAVGIALIANTAAAQNIGNNAGIWWNPAPGQPSAFTFLNPLTTVYGRVGLLYSFNRSSELTLDAGGLIVVLPGQRHNVTDQWGGMLGAGFRLMPVLRYEMQMGGIFGGLTDVDITGLPNIVTGRISSVQWMHNVYVDLAPFFANGLWGLSLYAMGGVGVSWNRTGDVSGVGGVPRPGTGITRTAFAWNVGFGLQWQLMRNLILDLGYRYLDTGRFATRSFSEATAGPRFALAAHQIMFSFVVPVDGLIRGFGN